MPAHVQTPSEDSPQRESLSILRLKKGTKKKVRLLSPSYRGIMTHFGKDGSEYCHPTECHVPHRKFPPIWKGYASVQEWIPHTRAWIHRILEITECLDDDVHDLWERGQIWTLSKALGREKQNPPLRGDLIGKADLSLLPAPLDPLPLLLRVYHLDAMYLDVKNPLPRRIYVEPSYETESAPPPPAVEPAADPHRVLSGAEIRDALKKGGFKPPSESK